MRDIRLQIPYIQAAVVAVLLWLAVMEQPPQLRAVRAVMEQPQQFLAHPLLMLEAVAAVGTCPALRLVALLAPAAVALEVVEMVQTHQTEPRIQAAAVVVLAHLWATLVMAVLAAPVLLF